MSDPTDLTPREMEVLALAWQCMDSDPKVDYIKLAELTGYTTASAGVTFGKIKRKLKAKATGSSKVPATPKKSGNAVGRPKTPKSGKRSATEDAAAGTPSKKGKKVSNPANNDEDDEEFGNFNIKKEEVVDISNGTDAFFQEANAYAPTDNDQV
ncbi:hypothetical protein BU25DRAFT_453942 [Macroventuria anomochaeta]|uniref:Uncharacterized protein n=1 Tax=Macroventuria anomochaeta TaxID=301207 RepID=A0ACB6SFL7_9PLEO|nr:uncharacterized protein BU25DRAFT_453942 [Macroventuria anomochaeta]KAF2632758.1 hypothetical protein BU25DRAFT_453942 [Macroventuria anomochaeta]